MSASEIEEGSANDSYYKEKDTIYNTSNYNIINFASNCNLN